ncbi:MAG: plastocyanin/azurin family copper-binding protein [Actinomycetota bacterium]
MTRPGAPGWVVAVALTSVLLAGCTPDEGPVVELAAGRRFEPERITIRAGETVTWVGRSEDAHTVTAYRDGLPDGAPYFSSGKHRSEAAARDDLASELLTEGETFAVRLDQPGTYRYFCIPHEDSGMTGLVVVEG